MPTKKPDLLDMSALLRALSPDQQQRLMARGVRVEHAVGTVLSESERAIEFVYFPETALVSLLCVLPDGSAVETAVVGREGVAPIAAFHGVDHTPEQIVVQVAGALLRVDVAAFVAMIDKAPPFRAALHRFAQALYTFAAQSSACNRMHSVSQRCARWLLATHDRLPGDEFALTHLFLSQMVGVRRSSVTLAAEALRDAGAISYARGKIRIVDRARLRERACDCYDIVRNTYDRLLEGLPAVDSLAGVSFVEHGKSTAHAGDPAARHPSRAGQSVEEASRELLAGLSGQRGDGERRDAAGDDPDGAPRVTRAGDAHDGIREALEHVMRAEAALRSAQRDDGGSRDR